MAGENVDDLQNLRESTKQLVHIHIKFLLCYSLAALHQPRNALQGLVNAVITEVVSKSVHDPAYKDVLIEEIFRRLSHGNTAEKALAVALGNMLYLAGTVDPETIENIPSILAEPLSSFVFGITPPSASSSAFTPSMGNFSARTNSMAQNNNADVESQMPIDEGTPKKARFSTEANLAIAAIAGSAVAGLMASGAEDSPALRAFAVASGVGLTGSFLAAHTVKKPKVSEFLSKVGAIGTISAFTIALGNTIETIMFGYVNVNVLAISLICLINAAVIFFGN